MAIINNRDKIQSEVSSKKYKDNWDLIWGKKDKDNDKVKVCPNHSKCVDPEYVLDCACLKQPNK